MTSNTRTVNVEDVTQQSKERLNDRVSAVEALAVAHNERVAGEDEAKRRREVLEAELAEQTTGLMREHKAKHDAAVKSGWTARDLRAMGLDVPTKPAPRRRQRKPSTASTSRPVETTTSAQHESAGAPASEPSEERLEQST